MRPTRYAEHALEAEQPADADARGTTVSHAGGRDDVTGQRHDTQVEELRESQLLPFPSPAEREGALDTRGPDVETGAVEIGHVEIVVTVASRPAQEPERDSSLASRKYLRRL